MHAEPVDIIVNGIKWQSRAESLKELLEIEKLELTKVATALNGEFIPIAAREKTSIKSGDCIEILSVRNGG